jgi:hypothetical protein
MIFEPYDDLVDVPPRPAAMQQIRRIDRGRELAP